MPLITHQQWSLLSDMEKEILAKMGLAPKDTGGKRNGKKKQKKPKPFLLAIYVYCSLCETEHVEKWKMTPALSNGIVYWQGRKIVKPGAELLLETKREFRPQSTCCSCLRKLEKLEKKTLITKLTNYAHQLGRVEKI